MVPYPLDLLYSNPVSVSTSRTFPFISLLLTVSSSLEFEEVITFVLAGMLTVYHSFNLFSAAFALRSKSSDHLDVGSAPS